MKDYIKFCFRLILYIIVSMFLWESVLNAQVGFRLRFGSDLSVPLSDGTLTSFQVGTFFYANNDALWIINSLGDSSYVAGDSASFNDGMFSFGPFNSGRAYFINSIGDTSVFGGNIFGIGTSTPRSSLDVEGGATIGTSYAGVIGVANGVLAVEDKVGIGTSSPAAALHVVGASRFVNANSHIYLTGATTDGLIDVAGSILRVGAWNGHDEIFIDLINHRVGIGNTSPNTIFHIDTDAANTVAIQTIENTAGNFQIFRSDATPEASITGSIGDLCIDGTNGNLYIKRTGTATNTGWILL